MIATIELTALDLVLAALLLCLNATLVLALRIPLGKRILVAALRATVQLSLLGLLLHWVFSREGPAAVLLLMLGMALLAGVEAVRRTR